MKSIVWQRRHIVWILVVMLATFSYWGVGSGEDGTVRELQKMTLAACCDRNSGKDFNTLGAAGNDEPEGIWSDGTTMWVADDQFGGDEKIYAYAMATRARDPDKDFKYVG